MDRNGKKRVRTGLVAVLMMLLCLFGISSEAAGGQPEGEEKKEISPPSGLYAQSAVLMDGDTGRILFSKDGDVVRPMASTTKIMTCILALELGEPEEVVTVSAYAASQPKVHLGASEGDSFYLKDLLYSLMLESHNDTAVMIAEHIGGSVTGFAKLMNDKARKIGCKNTHFITPNGLDATEPGEKGNTLIHSTTAADLAAIMAYCVWQSPAKEAFLKITGTQNYVFSDRERKGTYSCVNHNALLTMMDHVVSGKTGFTGGAGYSYVGAFDDGQRHLTLALLGCGWPPHKTYKWSDARKLFRYGREAYERVTLMKPPTLPRLLVLDGVPEDGTLSGNAFAELVFEDEKAANGFSVLLKEGEQVTIAMELPESLTAPVAKGMKVGTLSYRLEDQVLTELPVLTGEAVEALSFVWFLKQTLSRFLF